MKHPSQMRESFMRASGAIQNNFAVRPMTATTRKLPDNLKDDHSFGMPLRPPTPIKAVIGNYYGEVAGFQHQQKAQALASYDETVMIAIKNPPKGHTKASEAANKFVSSQVALKKAEPKTLFKMKKFDDVAPRTSTKNDTYKPAAKRSASSKPAPKKL